MAKLGLSIRIDVKKIEKARLYEGEKGTYLDLTTFINLDEPDQYGNHGFISQSVSKEDREQGIQTTILGNAKVFYNDNGSPVSNGAQQQQTPQPSSPSSGPDYGGGDLDQDIPFLSHMRFSEYAI